MSIEKLPMYKEDDVDLKSFPLHGAEEETLKIAPGSTSVTMQQLEETHSEYDNNINEWQFLNACYEGIRELKRLGIFKKHERESLENFEWRKENLYSFGYSSSIVDLFTFYLFKKEPMRDLGALADDVLWQEFAEDCDLFGNEFDQYLNEENRNAGIYGHVGILVDKASANLDTLEDERRAGLYPYLAAYHPPAILDWEYRRDETNRPYLAFLKLQDDDGQYRLWWPDRWEVWREPKEAEGKTRKEKGTIQAELVSANDHTLGVIPFVWLYNLKSKRIGVGISDIKDISHIDFSIINNTSQGEEVITYAGFPIVQRPMVQTGSEVEDEVGVTAVWEFDPENPAGTKSEWLRADVGEPISAILGWLDRKVQEIYRASNSGGMAATQIQTQAKSGVAMQTEFQMLNARLCGKAVNLEKAERAIIWLWLKWQGQEGLYDKIVIERSRKYDVENLSADLANALTSKAVVRSDLFAREVEKNIARAMLPSAEDDVITNISEDIDNTEPPSAPTFGSPGGGGGMFGADEDEDEEEDAQE